MRADAMADQQSSAKTGRRQRSTPRRRRLTAGELPRNRKKTAETVKPTRRKRASNVGRRAAEMGYWCFQNMRVNYWRRE